MYEATCPSLGLGENTTVIARLARFPWGIGYYDDETHGSRDTALGPNLWASLRRKGGWLASCWKRLRAEPEDLEQQSQSTSTAGAAYHVE